VTANAVNKIERAVYLTTCDGCTRMSMTCKEEELKINGEAQYVQRGTLSASNVLKTGL